MLELARTASRKRCCRPASRAGRSSSIPRPPALRDRDRPGPHATLVAPLTAGLGWSGCSPSSAPVTTPPRAPRPSARWSCRGRARSRAGVSTGPRPSWPKSSPGASPSRWKPNASPPANTSSTPPPRRWPPRPPSPRPPRRSPPRCATRSRQAWSAVYTSAPERPDRLVLQHHLGSADTHAVLDPARTGRRWPAVDAVGTGSPIWLNDERAWSTRYPHLADRRPLPGRRGRRVAAAGGGPHPRRGHPRLPDRPRSSPPTNAASPPRSSGWPRRPCDRAVDALPRRAAASPQTLQQQPAARRAARATTGWRWRPATCPATAGLTTGGDWYDALNLLCDGRVVLAVGDVAGHGVPAAAVMGQIRNVLGGAS